MPPIARGPNDDATANSTLLSCDHDRERREERQIQKIDLQSARRYGMTEPTRYGRTKHTYGGVVFIYDPRRNTAITSFASSDRASPYSGTRCTQPLVLKQKKEYMNMEAQTLSRLNRTKVLADKEKWTSHTVLVVDLSGSMRIDDVDGARCRADGVWISLAKEFVHKQLTAKHQGSLVGGARTTIYDVVSVVLMNEVAEAVIKFHPVDWVLYNKLLALREWTDFRPRGPGNYQPALDEAEKLLNYNQASSCSLTLMFFSDGKPSDQGNFAKQMGEIASKFGRRLNVCCIGMADESEDFSTLENMVKEASSFGSPASFNKPLLGIDSLSNIITSLVTSLTNSKTEMTDLKTGKSRLVRMDVRRERRDAPDDLCLNRDWEAYTKPTGVLPSKYVPYIWSWSYTGNDFVTLLDPRCIECYAQVADENMVPIWLRGRMCPGCKACFFCWDCDKVASRKHTRECARHRKDRREGMIFSHPITSFSLAVKSLVFDEGAERIVYKVRFLDENNNFVGPKMVAKESRFIERDGDYDARMDYHRDFLRTQSISSQFASLFNAQLDMLDTNPDAIANATGLATQDGTVCWKHLPRIRFLNPMVVELLGSPGEKERNILIEEQLSGKYQKFNSNAGFVMAHNRHLVAQPLNRFDVDGGRTEDSLDGLANAFGGLGLGAIEEGSEDELDDEDDDSSVRVDQLEAISDYCFPQAFSHFTYVASKKQMMVVDLQGVLQVNSDGTREFVLTDPAIHKRKRESRSNKLDDWSFGRTDRGEKGMKAFFSTHVCTGACRLLGLEPYKGGSSPIKKFAV